MPPQKKGKKVAPTPSIAKKAPAPVKATNPLYEKRSRSFGIGANLPPKKPLNRFVKWPKYVRIQRQKRILSQRLKVPRRSTSSPRLWTRTLLATSSSS